MMRVAALAVALTAAVASPGAGGVARGGERGYDTFVPPGLTRPAPAIVVLHCYGCTAKWTADQLGLEALARRHGIVLALPSGHVDARRQPFWNATPACCDFDHTRPDDVGYIEQVIADLVRHKGVDAKRVYLIGVSNGGFLAHRLACDDAAQIAAIVSIGGGGVAPAACKPKAPVAVLEVHGDGDRIVPLDGGPLGGGLPQQAVIPAAKVTLSAWARRDHCAPAPAVAAPIDVDAQRPGAETHVDRWRCPRAAVELWTVRGGGHVPQLAPGAAEAVWQFLAAQHR
jgi:polyhydroxybutyrate depolymerase